MQNLDSTILIGIENVNLITSCKPISDSGKVSQLKHAAFVLELPQGVCEPGELCGSRPLDALLTANRKAAAFVMPLSVLKSSRMGGYPSGLQK